MAFVLVDEGQQFVAGEAIFARGPVAPAVRRFDDGVVGLAVELRFFLMHDFEVVEDVYLVPKRTWIKVNAGFLFIKRVHIISEETYHDLKIVR